MLRISVTTIEQFRSLLYDEYTTKESLISSIKREFKPSIYMELGSAFHNIIEQPENYYNIINKNYTCDSIIFKDVDIDKCIDTINYKYPFEIKLTKIYNIAGEDVEVVAQVDQLQGLQVNEFKTAWSYFGGNGWKSFVKQYYESVQWKWYCMIFETLLCQYSVFLFNILKDEGINLIDIIQFKFEIYDGMKEQMIDLLTQFTAFIHANELEQYFIKDK